MDRVADSPRAGGGGREPLAWSWIAVGVVVGLALTGALVTVVRNEAPRPDIAILIGGLTLTLTGVLVGYRSPGETVAESAIAGAVVGGVGSVALVAGFGFDIAPGTLAAGWVTVVVLSALGGWVGEILQGTVDPSRGASGFSWPWVLVGTVLGVVLNAYSVFVVRALFAPPGLVLAGTFTLSFILAGFFVGYFSPGVTILEPAVAALLIVAVDTVVLLLLFASPFPPSWILIGSTFGFVTGLIGGFAGEAAQDVRERRRAAA